MEWDIGYTTCNVDARCQYRSIVLINEKRCMLALFGVANPLRRHRDFIKKLMFRSFSEKTGFMHLRESRFYEVFEFFFFICKDLKMKNECFCKKVQKESNVFLYIFS